MSTIEARRGASVAWSVQLGGTAAAMGAAGTTLIAAFTGTSGSVGAPLPPPVVTGGANPGDRKPVPALRGEPASVITALDVANSGALRWRTTAESSEWATVAAIAALPDGGAIAGGAFSGTLRIGAKVVSSAGKSDGFVVRLDASGAPAWLVRVGGPNADAVQGVAARGGRIAIAGTFAAGAELHGVLLPAFDERTPFADGFVAELDAAGARTWAASFGGKRDDAVAGVAIDSTGQVVVAGTGRDTIHIGGTDLDAQGDADAVIGWWTKDGVAGHAVLLGGPDFDGARSIIATGDRVVVSGFFSGQIRIGGRTLAAGGGDDSFIAAFDAAPVVTESWQIGGAGREEVTSLAAVPGGFIAGVAHTAAADLAGEPLPAPADPMAGAALVVRPVR